MKPNILVKVIDRIRNPEYERLLYRCLFHSRSALYKEPLLRRRDAFYNRRYEYLRSAIPRGFHKKILIFKDDPIATIEYASLTVPAFPSLATALLS